MASHSQRSPASASFSADLHRITAIFTRDRRLATSYSANFVLSWFNIVVEVTVAFFLSLLAHPSERFGWNGHIGSYFSYLVINFAILRFQMVALTAFSEAIREGQMLGTLEVVLATPTDLPLIVLSSGLWSFALTGLQTATYVIAAIVYGMDVSHTNVVSMFGFLILTVASIAPIGVIAAAATMVFKKQGPVEWLMTSTSTLFAGVYLPISLLPHGLQVLSWFLPLTHALNGFRGAIFGASLYDLRADALWLCVFTLVALPVALGLFARAVKRSKIDGTLGLY